jgi:hypothetical protein
MNNFSKHFQYLVEKNGIPENPVFLESDFFETYHGRLPASLLDFWNSLGLGEWFGGLLRFVDPRDYSPILALWFSADKDFSHKNTHVIARNAFGDLYIWNEKYMRVKIDSAASTMSGSYLFQPEEAAKAEIVVASTFMTVKPTDEFDENDKPMFKRCVGSLGPVAEDEIYGFKLPLALGGARNIGNIAKLKTKEHLMILAQTEPLKLMDYSNFPPRFVREIG